MLENARSALSRPSWHEFHLLLEYCLLLPHFRMNMAIYLDFSDPSGHLAWLAQELQESEDMGEKVREH